MNAQQNILQQSNIHKDIRKPAINNSAAYANGNVLTCEKHGEYQEKELLLGSKKIVLSYCMACQKEKNDRDEAIRKVALKNENLEIERRNREKAGVSRRNENVRFSHFKRDTPEQESMYNKIHSFAKKIHQGDQVSNVILTGKVGTGKTMIANCVINSLFKSKKVKLVKLQDMLRKIKGSYASDASYTEEEAIRAYSKFDLLILDEVGVSRDTDTDKNIIFDVLDGRYQNMLPTMIISNMNIDGIKQTLGDRVVDRLRDGGGILIGCDWESFRK
jgi:DNA replication protein DnaC